MNHLEPCCCSSRKAHTYQREKGTWPSLADQPRRTREARHPGRKETEERGGGRAAGPGAPTASRGGRREGGAARRGRGAGAPAPPGHCRRVLTLGCFLAWLTITRNIAAAGADEGLALYQAAEPVLPLQLPRPNVTRGPRRGRCPPPQPGCSSSGVRLFALRRSPPARQPPPPAGAPRRHRRAPRASQLLR